MWLTVSASRSSGRIFCPFFMNQSLSLGGLKRSLTFLYYLGLAHDYLRTQAIGDIYLVCRFSHMVSIRCLCIGFTFHLILAVLLEYSYNLHLVVESFLAFPCSNSSPLHILSILFSRIQTAAAVVSPCSATGRLRESYETPDLLVPTKEGTECLE